MEKVQFITHCAGSLDEVTSTDAVLQGGCRWIQLRMKDATAAEIVRKGRMVGELCRRYGAVFIIDDHVELVEDLGADGVHLGKSDMPVDQARRLLGPHGIIGATANTIDDIRAAVSAGADYVGLGPFRFTVTKRRLSPVLGLAGYEEIMARCRAEGIDVPIVAIGGITADDVCDIMSTGVSGIAVSGALLGADDTVEETRKFMSIVNK